MYNLSDKILTTAEEDFAKSDEAKAQLIKEIDFAKQIHMLGLVLFEEMDGKATLESLELYKRAYVLLGVRSATHLRGAIHLISKGYPAEVAVLGCTLIEIFLHISYIEKNHKNAAEWFTHDNLYRPVWKINDLFVRIDREEIKEHYATLSKIKHAQFYGTGINISSRDASWHISGGPSNNYWLCRWVFGYCVSAYIDMLARVNKYFLEYHPNPNEWLKEFKRIDGEFNKAYKQMREETKASLQKVKKEK